MARHHLTAGASPDVGQPAPATLAADTVADPDLIVTVHGNPAPQGSKRHVGGGVMVEMSKAVKPWREAIKHAALAVIPQLDEHFPKLGPCGICGVPGEDQRHRVVDAIRGSIHAGDPLEHAAAEYGVSIDAARSTLFPLTGPLSVEVTFTVRKPASAPKRRTTWPAKRPDLDKLLRSTFDGLGTAGAWGDDSQVVEVTARKVYPGEGIDALNVPGAVIRIWRLGEAS
jgi:Holliday junction resolvase RusA-like endonuclease